LPLLRRKKSNQPAAILIVCLKEGSAMSGPDHPETQPGEHVEIEPGYFPDELTEESDDTAQRSIKIESMTAMIARMEVSDKIKLALIGNKEARGLLIKDSNKIIVKNVMENPRLTDDEVIAYAGNKNLSGEVPRIIAGKKQFLKSYKIRCALVRNPKTPVPNVIKLMPTLTDHELRDLARSTAVSGIAKATARRLLTQRGKH